jgi:DMSO/TMAO reductase YedYZ molybdopterin-dependent catalytic subunit
MSDTPPNPNKLSRRAFLMGVTGSAIAVAAGCRPAATTVPTVYPTGSARLTPNATAPTAAPTVILTPGDAPPDAAYGKITHDQIIVTSVQDFYVTQYDYNRTPEIDSKKWTLKIDGLVETPVVLTHDELLALPIYEEMRTLQCIGNPVGGELIGNAVWAGTLLQPLLDRAQISAKATHAKFYAEDGYSTAVQLKFLTQPNVMLAHRMNGQPLNTTHGFPARIMMPGLYGQKMPRWLTRIELIDYDYIGYWEGNGYSNLATVNTNSIIQSPREDYRTTGLTVGAKVQLQGIAYGAPRLITKVEVRINDGAWLPAKVTRGPNNLTWTQWRYEWVPAAVGGYDIFVRATDDSGFTQTKELEGLFDRDSYNGTTVIHKITLRAEKGA